MRNYLEFENEIKTLEDELSKLKDPFHKEGISEVDTQSIEKIQNQINLKLQSVYSDLTPWQKILVARHEQRPKSKFYIENLFTNFIQLSVIDSTRKMRRYYVVLLFSKEDQF